MKQVIFASNIHHYHCNDDYHDDDDFHDIDVSGNFRNKMDLEKAERVISAGKQAAQEMGVSIIIL